VVLKNGPYSLNKANSSPLLSATAVAVLRKGTVPVVPSTFKHVDALTIDLEFTLYFGVVYE
jgi:hypothetical protein